MSSSHENDQKSQELHCLQIAIEAKKQQKGESRKILELLAGEDVYRAHEERPDFVRRISPQKEGTKSVLLGIEHFRVDHLAIKKHPKKSKKAQSSRIASVAPVLDKKKRATYEKWNNCLDESGILPEEFFEEAAQDLFDLAGEHMQKVIGANYRSLLASLQQNLETHVKSIPTYQENLRKIAQPGEKIQIALLIDLYAEFFSLMKFDSRGIRACKIGEVPLFQEVIALIERIIDKSAVDYVILCLNSSITERTPKVYAFRAGEIERQIHKRHLKIYKYLAMDLLFEPFSGRPYEIAKYSFSPVMSTYPGQLWVALAEGRITKIQPISYSQALAQNITVDYAVGGDHYDMALASLLHVVWLYRDKRMSAAEKVREFFQWTCDNLLIGEYMLVYITLLFTGYENIKAPKNANSKDVEKVIAGCENQAWDISYLTHWSTLYEDPDEYPEEFMFATNDILLKRIFIYKNNPYGWNGVLSNVFPKKEYCELAEFIGKITLNRKPPDFGEDSHTYFQSLIDGEKRRLTMR